MMQPVEGGRLVCTCDKDNPPRFLMIQQSATACTYFASFYAASEAEAVLIAEQILQGELYFLMPYRQTLCKLCGKLYPFENFVLETTSSSVGQCHLACCMLTVPPRNGVDLATGRPLKLNGLDPDPASFALREVWVIRLGLERGATLGCSVTHARNQDEAYAAWKAFMKSYPLPKKGPSR